MKSKAFLHLATAFLTAAGVARGDAATIAAIMNSMTPDDFFTIANRPVDEGEYALSAILPDELRNGYEARSGSIRVISTPAGETGMDSPYVPVGGLEMDAFSRPIAKFSAEVVLSEQLQRELQATIQQIRLGNFGGGDTLTFLRNFVLDWLNTVIRQAFSDKNEMMKAEVLTTGALVLRGGTISYGVPAANLLPARTGTASYTTGTASAFWADMRAADSRLNGAVRARVMSMNTLNKIIDNPANNIVVTGDATSAGGNVRVVQVRRVVNNGAQFSLDARDGTTLIGYGRRVQLRSPGGAFVQQQVMPDGKIAIAGTNEIQVLQTAGMIVRRPGLGRFHIGPTVENDGRPGIWVRGYTPEGRPMNAVAQGVENGLPILDAAERLVIATTADA